MSQKTRAEYISLGQLVQEFKDKTALIPLLQRNYRWGVENKKNDDRFGHQFDNKIFLSSFVDGYWVNLAKLPTIQKLFDDIYETMPNKEHTIGMLALYEKGEVIQIIDGQQRLISLSIIVKALGDEYYNNFIKIKFERDVNSERESIFTTPYVAEKIIDSVDALHIKTALDFITKKIKDLGKNFDKDEFFEHMMANVKLFARYTETKPLQEYLCLNDKKTKFSSTDYDKTYQLKNDAYNNDGNKKNDIIKQHEEIQKLLYTDYDLYKFISKNPTYNFSNRMDCIFKRFISSDETLVQYYDKLDRSEDCKEGYQKAYKHLQRTNITLTNIKHQIESNVNFNLYNSIYSFIGMENNIGMKNNFFDLDYYDDSIELCVRKTVNLPTYMQSQLYTEKLKDETILDEKNQDKTIANRKVKNFVDNVDKDIKKSYLSEMSGVDKLMQKGNEWYNSNNNDNLADTLPATNETAKVDVIVQTSSDEDKIDLTKGGKISFKSLLNLGEIKEIIIPSIQRDYTLGNHRISLKNLFDDMVKSFKEGEEFKFSVILGCLDNGTFYLYDGQQRLVTLVYLSAFLINKNSTDENPYTDEIYLLRKFRFEERNKANELLIDILNKTIDFETIKENYQVDHTTFAIIQMFKTFDEYTDTDKINLTNLMNRVQFEFAVIKETSVADQLFMDLNTNNAPLYPHEIYKAELVYFLSTNLPDLYKQDWKYQLDNKFLNKCYNWRLIGDFFKAYSLFVLYNSASNVRPDPNINKTEWLDEIAISAEESEIALIYFCFLNVCLEFGLDYFEDNSYKTMLNDLKSLDSEKFKEIVRIVGKVLNKTIFEVNEFEVKENVCLRYYDNRHLRSEFYLKKDIANGHSLIISDFSPHDCKYEWNLIRCYDEKELFEYAFKIKKTSDKLRAYNLTKDDIKYFFELIGYLKYNPQPKLEYFKTIHTQGEKGYIEVNCDKLSPILENLYNDDCKAYYNKFKKPFDVKFYNAEKEWELAKDNVVIDHYFNRKFRLAHCNFSSGTNEADDAIKYFEKYLVDYNHYLLEFLNKRYIGFENHLGLNSRTPSYYGDNKNEKPITCYKIKLLQKSFSRDSDDAKHILSDEQLDDYENNSILKYLMGKVSNLDEHQQLKQSVDQPDAKYILMVYDVIFAIKEAQNWIDTLTDLLENENYWNMKFINEVTDLWLIRDRDDFQHKDAFQKLIFMIYIKLQRQKGFPKHENDCFEEHAPFRFKNIALNFHEENEDAQAYVDTDEKLQQLFLINLPNHPDYNAKYGIEYVDEFDY